MKRFIINALVGYVSIVLTTYVVAWLFTYQKHGNAIYVNMYDSKFDRARAATSDVNDRFIQNYHDL